MSQRREALWEYLRGAMWVLPAASVVLALVTGGALSTVRVSRGSPLYRLVFQGTTDDARTLLVAIASTMVTVIALILGLTVVALQLSSTQYSPRLLRNFLRDRPNQLVLSAFVATFAYSTAGLYTVGVSEGNHTTNFPRLAVTFAIVLLFVSLGALVYEVHHVSHSMKIDEIMRRVEDSTQQVVRRGVPQPTGGAPPVVAAGAVPVRAVRSGYVQSIRPQPLIDAAGRLRACVAVVPKVGEHVVAGTPLAWAWRDAGAQPDAAELRGPVRASVRIGFERTLEQDASFGIRQLVDIASKALSAAVNDPYTAVQALDRLATVLATIARRPQGYAVYDTSDAGTTVTVPAYEFADYLELACAQVRRFGAGEPAVARALVGLLGAVAQATEVPERHAAIGYQLGLVADAAERAATQPEDMVRFRAEVAQLRRLLSDAGVRAG